MMQRTIVTIEERDGELTAKLDKAPAIVKDAKVPVRLGCTPGSLPLLDTPENIKAYGEALRSALMNHPAISTVLQQIFSTPVGSPRILCFQIESTQGEQIRWEVLTDTAGNFVALDDRFHLGRIAEDTTTAEGNLRLFVPPLRIAAFLSAATVDAAVEWQGLHDAIAVAQAGGAAIEAKIYVGQQAMLDDYVNGAVSKLPGVAVLPMPATTIEVEQRLNEWQPHIVHFFCHGSAGYGTASLELATVVEHDMKKKLGSINLNVDELAAIEGLRTAWLVVLNCCEGGQAAEALHSMAYSVVAKGGIPGAIGMQEAVAVGDANTFCARLYPELFRALDGAVKIAAGAVAVSVDLTAAVGRPRRAIRDQHTASPADFKRWTLPVLYVHDQPLQVYRAGAVASQSQADAQEAAVAEVANFLAALPPDAPDTVRDRFLAVLDKYPGLSPEMRPDRFGNLPGG